MKNSSLVYLDTSFIAEAYEDAKGTKVPVTISKANNISTGFSIPFLNAGASATETKVFPISSRGMYEEIGKELEAIATISFPPRQNNSLPDYFWTTGVFGAAASQNYQGEKLLSQDHYFALYKDLSQNREVVTLVTNDSYFTTGYDQVKKHLGGACQGFGIEVRGLFKSLAHDPKTGPICTPLVLHKIKNV